MGSLTSAMIKALAGFRPDRAAALTADLNAGMNVQAVSASGACNLTSYVTELTVSGTKAYTLAAPTQAGMRKIIRCVSAASIPVGTLTITSPDDTAGLVCASSFVFDTAGQEIELEATAALKWRCVRKKRAGGTANNVVVGTTVLTGYSLWVLYALSVDGTKSSTGTKAIPDGSVPGERIVIANSTATNIPVGDIDFAGATLIGGAVTHMQAIGATTDTAVLEWNGAKWQVVYSTGITFA